MDVISVRSGEAGFEALLRQLPDTSDQYTVVCAGDTIEADAEEGFLRGHGTQPTADALRATQCGVIRKVNKLVSVHALRQRYVAELGDVVVGRVTEIAAKRWKLDLQSRQEAALHLSAVNLPGGVQRRRTVQDELNMRAVYKEGDLISAEVQSLLHSDGAVALQTRSSKYGKLQGGQLVVVPSILVPRQKQHFSALDKTGVALVMGVNGLVWVGWDPAVSAEDATCVHEQIARAANAIRVLSRLKFSVTPGHISMVYQEGLKAGVPIHATLHQQFLSSVCAAEKRLRK